MAIKETLEKAKAKLNAVSQAIRATETATVENKQSDIKIEDSLPIGLTAEEAARRKAEGLVNISKEKAGKSYLEIVRDNLFTYFNLVWAIVAFALIAVGSPENLTFLAVVVPNLLISVIQESRAKATVEKLSVTTEPHATVIRDGTATEIFAKDIVLGDTIKIELGRQVLSDAVVISGMCEVNESLLTGESVPVKKLAGDRLLAGSFLVSGSVYAEVDRVGKDNYIHKIEKEAKTFKKPVSNLFKELNSLIKGIGIFLIPITAISFFTNWLSYSVKAGRAAETLLQTVVKSTCGSIIGMIPAGIYLLVTLTLSLSVITLGRRNTLVQDMYSIEMLASADILCLDKTGTITDGTMQVSAVEELDGTSLDEIVTAVSYLEGATGGLNATSRALTLYFGRKTGTLLDSIPFSSERKYSAISVEEIGSYAIGAPHFVPCHVSRELEERISEHARIGERVLLLVKLDDLNKSGRAIALIAIEDKIRPNAKETIERFQSQGVTVKVISGDHAQTVASIARKVGIKDADNYISCEELTDEELAAACETHAVFGRVTPEQKVLLVNTLKKLGHTVAMTGDGVNDTLALKEANCAIAMADGSEVARKISQIVLMNSDFGSLPAVVKEGRRCINNVRQSAVLYLMKTLFTIVLTIVTFAGIGYPFAPNSFLFLELFVIGLASVLLALEPNDKRIEGSFLDTVMVRSFPCALAMLVPVAAALLVGEFSSGVSVDCRNAVAMCVVTLVGFTNLIFICRPYTKWRMWVALLVGVLLGGCITGSIFMEMALGGAQLFGLINVWENPMFFLGMLGIGLFCAVVLNLLRGQLEAWARRLRRPLKRGRKQGEI